MRRFAAVAAAEQTFCLLVKGFSERKGIDKNIWVKNFIKNILYSKEEIFITLYYKRGLEGEDSLSSDCGCLHPAAVRKNASAPHKKITPISTDRGNETHLAPRAGLEPATYWLQLALIFLPGLDYLIILFLGCRALVGLIG